MSFKKKAVTAAPFLAVAVLAVVVTFMLTRGPGREVDKRGPVPEVTATPASVLSLEPANRFASLEDYDKLLAEDAKVKPVIQPYTIKPDLSNVVNLKVFEPILEPQMIDKIAKNGFVVTPTDYIQMFYLYENNEYQRPDKFPSFITTDSMLHAYHVFYNFSLRIVESEKLYDAAVELTDLMLKASEKDLAEAKDELVKDAARRNVAYFAVARALLVGTPPPASVADIAEADLKKIKNHLKRDQSSVLGYGVDFTQFVPRGHYTRTEKLKKYFHGLMWYGLMPFPTGEQGAKERPTVQALLIVRNLEKDKRAMQLWDKIYEPTAFYVGKADDYTVYDYSALKEKVYGKSPSVSAFDDTAKLQAFIKEVGKLPGPRIENFVAGGAIPTGRQFRFMGQRFIPDSRILQEMSHPKVAWRAFPSGMDVFSAIGSDRALELLRTSYKADKFEGFDKQMELMRKEMKETPRETWQSNLYWGWLWTLQSVIKPVPEGYPSFMRNQTWQDKSLFTALGSWTELRHDTILYAKQSVAECGGDGDEPKTPKGYVEPNLEFWTKMKWLNDSTMQGLSSRDLLTEELKDKFERLGDWIDFCRKITIKELTNQKITDEEYEQICIYGASLESMILSFAGGDVWSDTDKDMAIVADVHTSKDTCLEEGTGRAGAIYVVVPIEGKLYLTRGAVYTHYEFMHPSSDRLTDEKWQEILQSGKQPPLVDWTKNFLVPVKNMPPLEFESFNGGC
ncbi:MAG TPA: DUF3160 domain-containing protein [Armatimonadota bacterium]|nr:DUF3160 domain-containing protein [Armatimonadota bacterium]